MLLSLVYPSRFHFEDCYFFLDTKYLFLKFGKDIIRKIFFTRDISRESSLGVRSQIEEISAAKGRVFEGDLRSLRRPANRPSEPLDIANFSKRIDSMNSQSYRIVLSSRILALLSLMGIAYALSAYFSPSAIPTSLSSFSVHFGIFVISIGHATDRKATIHQYKLDEKSLFFF